MKPSLFNLYSPLLSTDTPICLTLNPPLEQPLTSSDLWWERGGQRRGSLEQHFTKVQPTKCPCASLHSQFSYLRLNVMSVSFRKSNTKWTNSDTIVASWSVESDSISVAQSRLHCAQHFFNEFLRRKRGESGLLVWRKSDQVVRALQNRISPFPEGWKQVPVDLELSRKDRMSDERISGSNNRIRRLDPIRPINSKNFGSNCQVKYGSYMLQSNNSQLRW